MASTYGGLSALRTPLHPAPGDLRLTGAACSSLDGRKKRLPAPLQRGAGAHGVLWLSSPGAGGSPGDYLSRGFMVGTEKTSRLLGY